MIANTKEALEKQVQLLSECSHDCKNMDDLCKLSASMAELGRVILGIEAAEMSVDGYV